MATVHQAFADLHAATDAALSRLADEWAVGHLSPGMFIAAVDEVLLEAHTQAVVIGRTHAGDEAPQETDDRLFAETIVESERGYLRDFRVDLDIGRYTSEDGERDAEAVRRRVTSYLGRVTGTATEAWKLTLPEDTLIWWRLSQPTDSACEDCPRYAEGSPYEARSMKVLPAMNLTACQASCRCWAETDGGQRGFVTP